jgi:hypothetical protein
LQDNEKEKNRRFGQVNKVLEEKKAELSEVQAERAARSKRQGGRLEAAGRAGG